VIAAEKCSKKPFSETQVITHKVRASCTQTSTSASASTPRGGAPGMTPQRSHGENHWGILRPRMASWRRRSSRHTSQPNTAEQGITCNAICPFIPRTS
jgi:hypothetical protein